MQIFLLTLVLVLMFLAAVLLIVRRFSAEKNPAGTSPEKFSPRNLRPMERLLNPKDCELLRSRGFTEQQIKRFRAQRLRIVRLYVREVVAEFNSVQKALELLLVSSTVNRPDLTKKLARKRFVFYRSLAITELRLVLHARGCDKPISLDMLKALEALRASLEQLVPGQAAAAC
jgi:hypothetical protein